MIIPEISGVPAFVHVAEHRSFRAAARVLGITPAAVSKAVARLEQRLGTVLLVRTSRHVALTLEGERYFVHCRQALAHLQAGEEALELSSAIAEGRVRLSASIALSKPLVAVLPRLVARHPRVHLDLSFTDRDVGLAAEDVDIAVRIGHLPDSALVARRLRDLRWCTFAAPSYLARSSPLSKPDDLTEHACLVFTRPGGGVAEWQFQDEESAETWRFRPPEAMRIDHGERLVDAAIVGVGVGQAFDFMVEEPVRRGELVEVLREWAAPGPPVHTLIQA
ncbi:MAG: LysR family transcriptional regulator, partial [Myxococcota bacterium]